MRILVIICAAIACSGASESLSPARALETPVPTHDARLDTYMQAAHMTWERYGASGFPPAIVFAPDDPRCPGGGFAPDARDKCTTGVYHRDGWRMELSARDLPSQSSLAHELYHALLDLRGGFRGNSGDWDHRQPGWFVICTSPPHPYECLPGSGPNDGVAGANSMLQDAGL